MECASELVQPVERWCPRSIREVGVMMAQFIPHDPETMEFGSEADVARAMIKQSGGYLVMHSLPLGLPAATIRPPAREGEADFLILTASTAVILEVKGGEIS